MKNDFSYIFEKGVSRLYVARHVESLSFMDQHYHKRSSEAMQLPQIRW